MKLLGQYGKNLMTVEGFMEIHFTLLHTFMYFRIVHNGYFKGTEF